MEETTATTHVDLSDLSRQTAQGDLVLCACGRYHRAGDKCEYAIHFYRGEEIFATRIAELDLKAKLPLYHKVCLQAFQRMYRSGVCPICGRMEGSHAGACGLNQLIEQIGSADRS
jgi:hypothetical protein